MSTNHNRIKVADLETNKSNKILITNEKGELEFNDVNNLQTEKYNALDCTTEGKALDARQGKVLKDMIDNVNISPPSLVNDLTTGGTTKALTAEMGKTLENTKLTASLATDAETQIASTVTEDKKVISRLKLFNWWTWVKSQAQTISGAWNFTNKVTLASGTINYPPLILPTGTFTNTAQNGAIERDSSGKLWTTRSGVRYMLTEDDGSYIKIILNGGQKTLDTPSPYITTNTVTDTLLGTFNAGSLSNSILAKLSMMGSAGDVVAGGGTIAPTVNKFQIVIKFTNALLSSSYWGPGTISELVLIDNLNVTGTTAMLTGTYAPWDSNVGLFNGIYVWDSANPASPKNLNGVSAQIFCRRRTEFADSTNANGKNQAIRVYTSITSTLIERIRM
ncbi:hypothetical protein SAMN05444671_3888 [Flavobacterium sp. CF108]|uniref:hypothetical protein n=1 Tax=unclassified Flavobacterium TaxID=196869 RepID=UPI0008C5F97A|nr:MULTISPECIES: hypothetical protein [unclassified Flavobacterium]SEO95865.1 hypothetical protein SAMN04487978_4083 [Flavobacterium sp. fv08]SHH81858.1 hypothetical protein SAMN05444671_3888 [Flavobacterium sp. CF108]